jgi:Fanconi anemia group M protein
MIAVKDFKPRLYQETIFSTCTKKDSLVILPTGMGKSFLFVMLASHRLNLYPNSKILILAPTKPLADQHITVLKNHLNIDEDKIVLFTGLVRPEKRAELWKNAQIIVSTPQGLENDILSNRINLEEASLLAFDEAHHAVGDYAYVFVAKQYQKKARYPRILALTASPGADMEKIKEVCKNLYIEEVEVRTDKDPDVKPYVQDIEIEWIKVNLPPIFNDVQKYIKDFLKDRLEKLKKWGVLRRTDLRFVNKRELLALQAQLRGRAASGERDFTLWTAISVLAEIMKIQHALELLETQGIAPLYKYLEKLQQESLTTKVKAVKNIVRDLNFRSALIKTKSLWDEKVEHPKLVELQKIIEREIKQNPNFKAIVFNQYRDNASDVEEKLNKIENIKAKIFVGQSKKGGTGYSQKEQKEILDKFRSGEFNVLVATSVGEEGLDIPAVPLVVFYEPIPSAIRSIQRRGRTGRQEKGRVIILLAKNTRDEGYRWSAHHKEKSMYRHLYKIKNKIGLTLEKPKVSLEKFVPEDKRHKIFVDHREKGSKVIKELVDKNHTISLEQLDNADYLLSSRVGVEFKTTGDFINSIIDGRLLLQIKDLKNNFERPLMIIEGEEDIYSIRNIHPNAIRGMLSTITVSYGIPILQTKNFKETAALMGIIAKREQEETAKDFTPHAEKRTSSLKEQQEYIVSALPGVGATLAKPLLKKFKTIKKLINAKKEKLEKITKIGPKKAQAIKDVVEKEYES